MDWESDFMEAKYHISIANRMLETYDKYPEKRVLIGVINEAAKASGKLIRSFLIKENVHGGVEIFLKKVAPKYLSEKNIEGVFKILEIERAQKMSPVEFSKNEKIILLINGKYLVLTLKRLREFVDAINNSLNSLGQICRQI